MNGWLDAPNQESIPDHTFPLSSLSFRLLLCRSAHDWLNKIFIHLMDLSSHQKKMILPFKGAFFQRCIALIPKMPTLQITRFSTEQSTQMTVGSGGLSLGKPNLESELYKLWAVLLSRREAVSWDSRISREYSIFWCEAYNHIYSLRSHSNVESDVPHTLFPQAKRRT